ncbi:hypothetical protein GGD92_21740 [Pseudomonas protegens]|uniref:Uncharacterized protein n=1 Tax=Pseudomonas protegens TaxID=380021 RepID=A0A7G7X4V0_9PSED|nr:hypothetical protein [Pseudomonas protegens]QNH74995.1 hypothetical protein GGI48_16815 [Pseudomonas protegens]QNL04189.1 hypothetical protein GGD92_21740 [Pseudomonas protegens]
MNQTDPWMVTYKDFQGCTERLTDEVDRLTSQTRAATAVLESSAKYTEHVEAVGMQIAQQVKNAEMAWSKADEVAVHAARQAHSAAFKGVEDSIKSVVAAVGRSAQQNANAAEQIGQSARQARGSIYYLSAGFLVIAALGVSAALYASNRGDSGLEAEVRLSAARFDLLWGNAKADERKKIVEIIQRQPGAVTR